LPACKTHRTIKTTEDTGSDETGECLSEDQTGV
jgi:hypothetical protein